MIRRYRYQIAGVAQHGQTWFTTGEVYGEPVMQAIALAISDSFVQLTEGVARYGQPGKTCQGPYVVSKIEIELLKDA